MTQHELSKAKNPDLRASLHALRCAAELARKTAIQNGTEIVGVRNGRLLRITAEQLRSNTLSESARPPRPLATIEVRSPERVPSSPSSRPTQRAYRAMGYRIAELKENSLL